MDKKKDFKKNAESHHFMDKLLTKLKMGKHGGEEKGNGSEKRLKRSESSSSSSRNSIPLITWETGKVNPGNMVEFSDQLQHLLEYVQTMKDVIFYTYEYPNFLHTKLEKEAMELRNLFRDIRSAALDIERIQSQRILIKKEKITASKKLDKLREDEIRELESIICAYAKPLHSKWETIKNTQKADVLENFMNEVAGKHRALEILQELVRRKLSKIAKKTSTTPFTLKKNISSSNVNNKVKNQDTKNWSINPFLDLDKFGQNVDKVMIRGTPDRDLIRMTKRKRQKELREERRRSNADTNNNTGCSKNSTENSSLDLQLVPIDSFPSEEMDESAKGASGTIGTGSPPATAAAVAAATTTTTTTATTTTTTTAAAATAAAAPARASPIINIEYASDDDSISMSSSDFTIESFVQGANAEMQPDLQNEMRNVLQALFGEIRHLPNIGSFTTRHRHNNSGNDLRSPRTASH